MSRAARLILFCLTGALLTGGLATLYVVLQAGGGAPGAAGISPEIFTASVLAVGLTLANLFVRFARWQFMLRRLDVRVPTIESLAAFVGSFALLPVPLLLGQLYARHRLLPEPRPSAPTIAMAFVWERWLDVWALLVVSALALPQGWNLVALGLAAAGLVPRIRLAVSSGTLALAEGAWGLLSPDALRFERKQLESVLSGRVFAASALCSLVAWGLAGGSFAVLGLTAGTGGSVWMLAGIGGAGILGGGLSLLPMGIAVSGFILLSLLETISAPATAALEAVFLYRVSGVWFSVVLGAVVLVVARRRARRRSGPSSDHFDRIDTCYDSWLPPHYRDHVVAKKVGFMAEHLASLGYSPLGLDIGCGRGWYIDGVRSAGTRTVGIDLSRRQLYAARDYAGRDTSLCQASLLDLPFRPGVYDFAYTINVFHHLPSRPAQQAAFEQVARVLRSGGLFFLHEMNVRNPLFRGYLGYVFPILKGIDEGVEHFLDPRRLPLPPSLELVSVDYFTFVPDVCPEPLLPMLRAVERRLERSRLAPMGVHFLAVLRRRAGC